MADFNWKIPDEVMRLQRPKQKERALQLRAVQSPGVDIVTATEIYARNVRKNPFVDKRTSVAPKKHKYSPIIYEEKKSVFALIGQTLQCVGISQIPKNYLKNDDKDKSTTTLDCNEIDEDDNRQLSPKYVPVDSSLKTKLRILSPTAGSTRKWFKN